MISRKARNELIYDLANNKEWAEKIWVIDLVLRPSGAFKDAQIGIPKPLDKVFGRPVPSDRQRGAQRFVINYVDDINY